MNNYFITKDLTTFSTSLINNKTSHISYFMCFPFSIIHKRLNLKDWALKSRRLIKLRKGGRHWKNKTNIANWYISKCNTILVYFQWPLINVTYCMEGGLPATTRDAVTVCVTLYSLYNSIMPYIYHRTVSMADKTTC